MVSNGLQDYELDRDDDEDWRLEDELQEEEELREFLEEMEEDDDEEYRLEDELLEDELPDVLEEIFPAGELASKDTLPIDPHLEEMTNHAGVDVTVPHVLDQAFASMEENETAALRAEDFRPEDFELEWLW